MYFSGEHVLENGIYLDGDDIFYRKNDDIEHVCNVNELRILGKHNYENVMAGVGAAKAMGIPWRSYMKPSFHLMRLSIELNMLTP